MGYEEGRVGASGLEAADWLKCARGGIHHGLIGAAGQGVWRQAHPQFRKRRLKPPGGRQWRVVIGGLQLTPCHLVGALRNRDPRVADVKRLAIEVDNAINAGNFAKIEVAR